METKIKPENLVVVNQNDVHVLAVHIGEMNLAIASLLNRPKVQYELQNRAAAKCLLNACKSALTRLEALVPDWEQTELRRVIMDAESKLKS